MIIDVELAPPAGTVNALEPNWQDAPTGKAWQLRVTVEA
jgi:hypothetical protein